MAKTLERIINTLLRDGGLGELFGASYYHHITLGSDEILAKDHDVQHLTARIPLLIVAPLRLYHSFIKMRPGTWHHKITPEGHAHILRYLVGAIAGAVVDLPNG